MAEQYQIPLQGNVIEQRLTAVAQILQDITTIYAGVGVHDTAILGHTQAINDLQSDVRHLRSAITLIDGGGGGGGSLPIVALTQESYDELATKDANTLYIII